MDLVAALPELSVEILKRSSLPCENNGEITKVADYSVLFFTMPAPDIADFLLWFQSEGGYVDLSAMDIVNFPPSEGGRGGIVLRDIPVSKFSI